MKKAFGIVLSLCTFSAFLIPPTKAAAQVALSKNENKSTSARRFEIGENVSVDYPEHWAPSAVQHANAFALITPAATTEEALVPRAKMLITTEKHAYHAAAVKRLAEIAEGVRAPNKFLSICGWPALQRSYRAPFPHVQRDDDDKEDKMTLWHTTAIAAGNSLIRFETVITPSSSEKYISDAEKIGKSAVCPESEATRTEFDLRELRAGTYASRLKMIPGGGGGPAPFVGTPRAALTAAGNGELEIGASASGLVEVVASNTAVAVSNDGGATFPTSTLLGFFLTSNRGDPSVAVGRSGAIYVTLLDDPPGPAGGFSASACTITVASSGNSGAAFGLAGAAFSCPSSGNNVCAPDQEHIAADSTNPARQGHGDQVYAVFRFFGGGASTCSRIAGGSVVPMITCSTNSGGTFGSALVIGQGDHPRITVGPDGTVYALYLDNNSVMLQRFTRCDSLNGMDYDGGAVTVAQLNLPSCPVAGLDRCTPQLLASPTLAVDDTDPQHVYVAFAQKSQRSGTGEDIVVMDSYDQGDHWNSGVTINSTAAVVRRFMPWSCTSGGTVFVSWYDRRAATATVNDSTDFFLGGALPAPGSSLTSIAETKLTGSPDAQCSLWGPALLPGTFNVGPDDTNDSESCSSQPQNAGTCQKSIPAGSSGKACDFSSTVCPSGEVCKKSIGIPKYGDYNGIACAAGNIYTAWASSTPSSTNVINGAPAIGIFNATIALPPPKLRLKVNLSPSNSSARFNLSVDGSVVASNVGNNASINVPGLSSQFHAVSVAGAGSTSLANYNLAFADDCSSSGTVAVFAGNNRTCEIALTSKSYNSCTNACSVALGNCMRVTHDSGDRQECIADSKQCQRTCN